jgi:GH24 family phage-related lysozyme (muramidase)
MVNNTYTFNVEKEDTFYNSEIGYLTIVNFDSLNYDDTNEDLSEEYKEGEFTGDAETQLEVNYEAWPKPTDESPDNGGNDDALTPTQIRIDGSTWYGIAATYISRKEGYLAKAKYDVNHYRGGYGTAYKLVGNHLTNVTSTTTFTKQEAIDTLMYQLKNDYEKLMISSFGSSSWNKLNNSQKAAIVSLAYNCGPYIYTATGRASRKYATIIYNGVKANDKYMISKGIASGPTTAKNKVLTALVTRRKEESGLALA